MFGNLAVYWVYEDLPNVEKVENLCILSIRRDQPIEARPTNICLLANRIKSTSPLEITFADFSTIPRVCKTDVWKRNHDGPNFTARWESGAYQNIAHLSQDEDLMQRLSLAFTGDANDEELETLVGYLTECTSPSKLQKPFDPEAVSAVDLDIFFQ